MGTFKTDKTDGIIRLLKRFDGARRRIRARSQFKNMLNIIWLVIAELAKVIWFVYADILYEPLFLGSTLFLIFNRLQDVAIYITTNPNTDLWQVFVMEMNAHPVLYSIFFFTLFTWMLIKIMRYLSERRREERMNTLLEAIATKVGVDTDGLLDKDKKMEKNKNGK